MPAREAGFRALEVETWARAGHQSGMHNLSKTQAVLSWALQLAAAGILLQTLFFKFTGAEESVYIFTTLGAEPWGRIGSGLVELIASVLLLIPATASIGALVALGVMAVAIASHLTVLGIDVKGDGGLLFGLALIVFACCAIVFTIRRTQLPVVGHYLRWA
jgi:putative oxidoreductase